MSVCDTLGNIPYQPDVPGLMSRLRIRSGSPLEEDFQALLAAAAAAARPKAFLRLVAVEKGIPGGMLLDGVAFHSQLLCANLAEVRRAFAYLATCGMELWQMRAEEDDLVRQFWLDAIMESSLRAAITAVHARIEERFRPAKMAVMHPGSLPDWPITQQEPFFELLGKEAGPLGVRLTESMLMVPAKSVTGLLFETESGFVNCQLCPRENCPNRQAGYDPRRLDDFNKIG